MLITESQQKWFFYDWYVVTMQKDKCSVQQKQGNFVSLHSNIPCLNRQVYTEEYIGSLVETGI